jgi:2-phospho-L-lactate/phosphoenolpyruvate guanylyltransferase
LEYPTTAIIVPIKSFDKSKTRLSRYMNLDQRIGLCRHLVNDLIKKVSKLETCQIIFITNELLNLPDNIQDNSLIINEGKNLGVNSAVALADSYIIENGFESSLVIPIDIPLLNLSQIREIIRYSKTFDEGICIVPSYRYDGTNILLRKPHTVIETSYDDNSFFNHLKRTMEKGASITIFDFDSLKADIDTIEDIVFIFKKYVLTSELINQVIDSQFNTKANQKNESNTLNYLLNILRQNHEIWY